MGRPRGNNRRRNEEAPQSHDTSANDIESRRARANLALQSYTSQPLDDRPIIAPATDSHRRRAMENWVSYFTNVMQIDPNQIWLDLCLGTKESINYCRVYLNSYIEDSMQKFVTLGPQEYEYRRTVNSASTVIQCWRELIAQADSTVLLDKRREDPKNFHLWRLKFIDHMNQRGQGPIFEICQWIFHTLAKEHSLATTLTFEKIEATAEDVVVLLKTLWQRAEDIPCQPSTRVSFHGIILLAAIGGFRRATIASLKYRDVCLAVVRDPSDRSKTKLVVTPTIGKNKLKLASRVSRALAISFSMTLVPYSPVCLASIIAARAIKDNAFKAGFESIEALLSRPALESVDFLPLDWKTDKLDRPIFSLANGTFYDLWHRTCLVSGLRENPRFYTMRVGAGGRLDGVLTDALRNYILSNTTQVFQGSYQTKRVREDLMKLAFGPMAGRNDDLFQSLRSMSLSRDAGAPVDVSAKDLEDLEKRRDMQDLRADLERARRAGNKDIRSIQAQIENRIETLSDLILQKRRAAYFEHVDSQRARGLATTPSSGEVRSSRTPSAVAHFLQSCARELEEGCSVEERAKHYMELLVDHLARRPSRLPPGPATLKIAGDAAEPTDERAAVDRTGAKQTRCLLCDAPFHGRSDLTKHCLRTHVKDGTFDRPFSCPECLRLELDDVSIFGGPSAWSIHAEIVHGKTFAPNLPSVSRPVKGSSRCLLCDRTCADGGGLWRHTRRIHEQNECVFKQQLSCPACLHQGKGVAPINGFNDWKDHVLSKHTDPEGLQPPLSQRDPPDARSDDDWQRGDNAGKRKRDEVDTDPTADDFGGDWLKETMAASDSTCTTPGTVTDSMSGTQTPSSVELDIVEKIDPRLLSGHLGPDHKRVKSSPLADPKVSNGPALLGELGIDPIQTADALAEDQSLHFTVTLDCFNQQAQAVGGNLQNLPSENITISPFASDLRGKKFGNPSPTTSRAHEDVCQIRLANPSRCPVEDEEEIDPVSNPAYEDLTKTAKLYWGRGYTLVPEGSELNRTTNNAQRREEISSDISSQYVITGKRLRNSMKPKVNVGGPCY